ncbi:uncharacterized protein LOC119023134 isoform X8 [Acanthopagrus latus]|uniref:uncharacterized protein LOC119023134 isoform X8 n=1 Tax=Acanthopagrus latus TaxID=8177 RepID=UPI00187C1B49|nr:uncharacterized protein LOC119023134 isoform X8 [Acanthopagrus latus]
MKRKQRNLGRRCRLGKAAPFFSLLSLFFFPAHVRSPCRLRECTPFFPPQSNSENDVDGETVDCGLTESMVGYLFDGSFKKQIKFQQFVWQYKEGETIITLQQVPLEVNESTTQLQPQPFTSPSHEPAHKRLPAVVIIPAFPKDVQMTLNAQERCHIVPRLRNNIIRVLYKMMAEYTLYPTNAEYVQVSKALIAKYPFLRDVAGNSYVKDALPAPAAHKLHDLEPGDWVVIWDLRGKNWRARRWNGLVQVLLTTETAVKIAERATWVHASHCKRVPEPADDTSQSMLIVE